MSPNKQIDILELRERAGVRMDPHVVSRLVELRTSEYEILRCIISPLETRPGGPKHGQCRRLFVGHRIVVVLALDTRTVVSVLLNTRVQYQHGHHTVRSLPRVA